MKQQPVLKVTQYKRRTRSFIDKSVTHKLDTFIEHRPDNPSYRQSVMDYGLGILTTATILLARLLHGGPPSSSSFLQLRIQCLSVMHSQRLMCSVSLHKSSPEREQQRSLDYNGAERRDWREEVLVVMNYLQRDRHYMERKY